MNTESTIRGSGLYIVTLNNEEPISVNADRPKIADRCIKVTRDNCKFGKALDLEIRRKNYNKVFGASNANFWPLVSLEAPDSVEQAILLKLDPYRIRGLTGRKNEWLTGITPKKVAAIVFRVLGDMRYPYEKLGTVGQRCVAARKTTGIDALWAAEAARRAHEMDRGLSQRISATDVCCEAQALLRR